MRRLIRIVGWLALTLVVLIVVAPVGFRGAAALRETLSPQEAAPAGALFATVDGLKMHYQVWGPPDGPPLLLFHGTVSWAETYRDIAAPLGEQGFRVIAVDMPPFGYSERPANQDYSRAAHAKRVLGFADALGLRHFSVGVHSYGGGGVIEAAFSAPDRIDALILLDVALGLGQTEAPALPFASLLDRDWPRQLLAASTFTNPFMTGFGLRQFIENDDLVTAERIAIYTRPLNVKGTTNAVGHWLFSGLYNDERKSLAANRVNYRAFMPPVLVIWGRDDTTTPLAQGQEIASLFPHAELAVLDGVNHIPQVERPQDVVRLIANFLKRTLPAAQ
ncbi:alpha/beta fold hydrolase [Mesorhizobium sp. NZP2298]|uniref:alpha/beta fold hydrolase n=1 Tax=Mesorhizobium sp. NZP2298 TaxID=2483403 RepID=UPI0015570DAE|nr:alpha/beta hydrolase [Mesorhizobium sp. NZP2298]QKC95396.1 alpha/beta hydrolase [Mesorhizobium sp. NZP2298]